MPITISGSTGIAGVDGSASTPAVQGTDTNTGIAFPAADTVAVATGGSERMRVDSSGNVGIGTSSPTAPLDVNGNVAITGTARRITGDFTNSTVASRLALQSSTTNGTTTVFALPNGTSAVAQFAAVNNSDPTNASLMQLAALSTESSLRAGVTGTGTFLPMTFYTGGSERARIDTSGNFQFNSGYGSVATAYGCRAWVNFNGTGTVAIRASGNVTSITDNGVGDYTVNFTTAMPDANYSTVLTGARQAGVYNSITIVNNTNSTYTTSAVRIEIIQTNDARVDIPNVNAAIFR